MEYKNKKEMMLNTILYYKMCKNEDIKKHNELFNNLTSNQYDYNEFKYIYDEYINKLNIFGK